MQLDFDYFSMVLAGVVRAVTDDQIVIDQAVSETTPKKLGKSILRNRYNTQVLSQLVYLGQYLGSSSAQAVGLLEAFEKALASLNAEEHKVSIDRNKPLVDVLADKNVLIAELPTHLSLLWTCCSLRLVAWLFALSPCLPRLQTVKSEYLP